MKMSCEIGFSKKFIFLNWGQGEHMEKESEPGSEVISAR